MKIREASTLVIGIVCGILALAAFLSSKVLDVKEDNAFEEAIEDIIEDQFDIDVDITPGSPEKN